MDLLRLLRAARWLTTGQVRRRFFPHTTVDAVHKRLRKLTEATYLTMVREHRMTEALFTLGPRGKRVLERTGAEQIVLERQPPKQLAHFIGINDLHLEMEMVQFLGYVRQNFLAGDPITLNILRDGKRMDLPMKLPW